MNRYLAFGLVLEMPIRCPELAPARAAPDLTVRWGDVPATLPHAAGEGGCFQAAPEEALIQLPQAAFWVRKGREVVVQRTATFDDASLRLFLLNPVMGVLLQQRRRLALHASVFAVGQACVGLLGHSSLGKSTFAAALARQGHPILSDEICLIEEAEDGSPWVVPAYPQLQLWEDALPPLRAEGLAQRPVRPKVLKYAFPIPGHFQAEPLPLARLYVLTRGQERQPQITTYRGHRRVAALLDYTYRLEYLRGHGLQTLNFQQCTALAQKVAVRGFAYPANWPAFPQVLAALQTDLQDLHTDSPARSHTQEAPA